MKKPAKKHRPAGLPSREEVVAFIGTHKGKAGVREIARAFGLKNADRASLRHMLRDLTDKGVVEGRSKKLHYAGTLPMSAGGEELTTDTAGRLARTRGVYIADGSVFPSLPSKGLTFTMMANADRIGAGLARRLRP